MQMALDALIDAADSQSWEMQQNMDQHGEWYRRSVYLKKAVAKSQEAIEALRAALAADEPSANRLTQPEQEPVAAALRHAAQVVQLYDDACSDNNYMLDSNDCEGILNALADYYDAGYTAPPQQLKQKPVAQVQVAEDYYPHVVFLDGVDTTSLDQKFLYTAPSQREWQGLTDEERKEVIRQQKDFWGPVGWELECVKSIETKLREKNSAI